MENENSQKRKLKVISVITLFICLIDFYIIDNFSKNYIILAAAAFVTLVYAVLMVNSWFDWKEQEKKYWEQQYSNIADTEKGYYILTQKKLKLLDDKLNFIGQKIMPLEKAAEVNQRKIAAMLDSIVLDQKKIGKITISRSKENADALMNSNDKLLQQMEAFRESMNVMQEHLLANQGQIFEQESQELDKNRDELLGKLEELSESLKSDNSETLKETASIVKDVEETMSQSDTVTKPEEAEIMKQVTEEPSKGQAEAVSEALSKVPEQEGAATEALPESFEKEESVGMESSEALEPDEPVTTELPERAMEAAMPKEAEKQEFDPNRPMNPEEIAALIANTAAEDLPETTEKYVEEEKPPMPDLSDPNKAMSPEDIAALIANM
ncbi:MAG: hypothetical protein HFI71_01255 [Lachnospiraceae bacterium]|nr:hypothetical protein [Lachnospiraceae bacterium]